MLALPNPGLLSPGELLEVLRGPPLEIEVHDRDRKLEKVSTSPALFGTYPNDDKLSSVVPVSGKRTNNHPFRENSKHYDPCGLAKLNLNDLLQGQRSLKVKLALIKEKQDCSLFFLSRAQVQ